MSRVCMRPGCDRFAVARLTYDTVGCQVWLDELPERFGPAPEICELHTDRLTVPRGWILCDRRAEQPALFVASPDTEVSVPAVTVIPSRVARSRAVVAPELFEMIDAPDLEPPVEIALEAVVQLDLVAAIEESERCESAGLGPVGSDAAHEEESPVEDPEPGEEEEMEHLPLGQLDDELPSSLRATSPLLARAFGATGPQHSVLTQVDGPRSARTPLDELE